MKGRVTVWKRGDVVRLKSGGPKMTVCGGIPEKMENIFAYSVTVKWFVDASIYESIVDSEAIRRATRPAE